MEPPKEPAPPEHVMLLDNNLDSSAKLWDSKINVCPGSSPTLILSEHTLEEEEHEETKSESSSCSPSPEESDSFIDWGSDTSWPDFDIPGTWGTQGLEEKPWDDNKKPYTRFRKYEDIELNEVESKGILTDRIIAACSSYLDKSPETGKYVLCKVDLSKKLLTDISIMTYHHYLQYVDLSWNELSDVEVLGQLPFLMYLDVSHNFLTKVLNFKPPFNLTYVNYSFNLIQNIDNLTDFWSIVHLDLSHNHISTIEGLQALKYLQHLNLSYNTIECIENLNNMRLLTLDLQHNNIVKFEEGRRVGFKTLIDILRINLGYNHLTTLKLFEGVTGIQSINVVQNSIDDLMEVTYLRGLNFLTEADFRGNPIVTMKFYMEVCITTIKNLYVLDGETIDATKKVSVNNSIDPSRYVRSMRKSTKIFFLQQINDPLIGPPVIPIDQPPSPIIVLVGPSGSSKGKLVQSFCKSHDRMTILGVSHTTRQKNEDEVDGETYYFIDDRNFRNMAYKGQFLTVAQTLGHYFGLAESELSKTVHKSGVLMLHMNLSGALTLRTRGLRCYYVLALPSTADVHRQWLLEKYYNWHESSKYVGAVEVENCPEKARHFLNECDKCSKSNVELMAHDIVTQMVSTATRIGDENESGVSETVDDTSNASTSSIGSVKMSSSSRTSGILKSPASKSKLENLTHQRVSVTFQGENTSTATLNAHMRLQPSRSVTFSDLQYAEQTEHTHLTPFSVSGTVMPGHEHDSGYLSVLSRPKRESAQSYPIVWGVQTEALKIAIEEIISSRDAYMEAHYSNPGLFSEVIFTDDLNESLAKLKHLLKHCIQSQPTAQPHYQLPKDAVYEKMVNTRLQSLHKEINSELSISDKQFDCMAPTLKSKSDTSPTKKSTSQKKSSSVVGCKLPKEIHPSQSCLSDYSS